MLNLVLVFSLFALLLGSALLILRTQSPLSAVILSGFFSLTICALYVIMDAVDVAFTEAAVGAGIATVLLLAVTRPADEPDTGPAWPSPLSIVLGLGVGVILVLGSFDMPFYGDPDAAVHNHLAPRFLGQSGQEIGIPNVVTSVLASYRGYDTLGEVVVIFTAGIAVLMLLWPIMEEQKKPLSATQNFSRYLLSNPVLKIILPRVVPLVILFALYVQFHGDYGPGGGFQAGVIFGAGLITMGLLGDADMVRKILPEQWVTRGMSLGVLLYAGVGVVAMLMGGNFLDYSVLASSQTVGQHIGILIIELGVGITVACTMLSLFLSFNRSNQQ